MLMRVVSFLSRILMGCLVLGIVGLFSVTPALAQEQSYTITGTVFDDEADTPLPGASVQIVNTTAGASTDTDGAFTIQATLEPGTYTLRYTFVGYQRVEQTIELDRDDTTVAVDPVRMAVDVVGSEEIVVTGTGVPTERRQLGNSISTIDAADLQDGAATSVDRALQGQIPGALVQQNSGNPAGGLSVRLRGTSTVLGSADPLYIVDGVIINNDSPELIDLGGGAQNRLVDLNPNDIERIEVVKGAAAAALYGSRANNGVVQIFTRRGELGAPRVSFSTRVQTEAVRTTLPVNMARNEDGDFIDNQGNPLPDGEQRWDFQDFLFNRAYGAEQSLSISGGNETTRYAASGSHFANQGIIEGNHFRRINGRLRLQQTLTDWASATVSASYARSTSTDIPNGGLDANYGALTGFIFGPNTFDPRANELGQFSDAGTLANPVEVIERFDFEQETDRFIGSATVNLTPTEALNIDYTFGLDTHDQRATAFIPRGTSTPALGEGFTRRGTRTQTQLNNDLNIRYQTDLSSTVEATSLIGGTLQYETGTIFNAQSENLTPVSRVVQSGTEGRDFGETRTERVIYGAFAQQTIGWADRLFLTGAARMDASSSFAEEERWQFYPKGSLSYTISDERFWSSAGIDRLLPRLKLRSSLGFSGGLTSIGAFDRFTTFSLAPYQEQPGLQVSSQLGAIDVQPERQREIELGADFSLLSDRIAVEATYYTQRTEDLLLSRSLNPTSGFLNRLENVGTLTNQGFEIQLRALPINQNDLRWTTTLTYSQNRNEVNGLEEDVLIFSDSFQLVGAINGEPLGIFYGSSFDRDDDGNVIDLNGNVLEEDGNGLWRMRDGSPESPGDGLPAASGENDIIGDPNPDFVASWINEVQINNALTLRMQWDAVYGQDVFNFTRRLGALSAFGTLDDYQRELEGDLPDGYTASTFNIFEHWVEDGSFLKLREISASYTIRPTYMGLESVRLNVAARNVLSIDTYSGYDPEINVAGQRTVVRNFDFVEVPIPRTFSLGITATF